MPRAFALIIALVFAVGTARAQTKRPMTIADLITTVRISDPQVSPDGKRVLYTRTTTAPDSGRRNTDIWTVPSDGSAPPRLWLGGERSESTARFTRDGKKVA